jgi:hypothetical protein
LKSVEVFTHFILKLQPTSIVNPCKEGRRVYVNIEPIEAMRIKNGKVSHSQQQRSVTAKAVLEELFELLEDYGPSWYTEEHHNRIIAALLGRDN